MGAIGMVNGKGGESTMRRNVVLADDSGSTVVVGFWGDNTDPLESVISGQTVVAIKNAQVSDYAGKSLNCSPSHTSKVFIDPEIERMQDILYWWCNLDDDSRGELHQVSKECPLDSNPANEQAVAEHKKLLAPRVDLDQRPKRMDEYVLKKEPGEIAGERDSEAHA